MDLEPIFEPEDVRLIESLLHKHISFTNSPLAVQILENWPEKVKNFVKVFPHEYKRILGVRKAVQPAEKLDPVLVGMAASAQGSSERAR